LNKLETIFINSPYTTNRRISLEGIKSAVKIDRKDSKGKKYRPRCNTKKVEYTSKKRKRRTKKTGGG